MTGKILKTLNGLYTVDSGGDFYACRAASRLRKEEKIKPLPGDVVDFTLNSEDNSGFIELIHPRKNSFIRPAVANVDVFVLTVATATPDPNLLLVDMLTVTSAFSGADFGLVITKSDLATPDSVCEIYQNSAAFVVTTSRDSAENDAELKRLLNGKTAVLTGVSGVGKSSLLNRLYPAVAAEVGDLSQKIQRGKNTTRVTEFFPLGEDTLLADTPGFSALEFTANPHPPSGELCEYFPEFRQFLGHCRYTKCSHTKEEGCAIISGIHSGDVHPSRHESFTKLYALLKESERF